MGSGGRKSAKGGVSNAGVNRVPRRSTQVLTGQASQPQQVVAPTPAQPQQPTRVQYKAMSTADQNAMLAQQRSQMNSQSRSAIGLYINPTVTNTGYAFSQNLNNALQTGRPLTQKQSNNVKELKKIMVPLADNFVLYRGDHDDAIKSLKGLANFSAFNGISSRATNAQLSQALVGRSWTAKGFTSTSHTRGLSPFLPGGSASGGREVVMIIHAKKGTKAAMIQRSQGECLLDTGTKYTITSARYTGNTAYPRHGGRKRQILIEVTAE